MPACGRVIHTSEKTPKAKKAAVYEIPQTETAIRKKYYFAVGAKTYDMSTVYETENIARNPDYIATFDKMVESLKLPPATR